MFFFVEKLNLTKCFFFSVEKVNLTIFFVFFFRKTPSQILSSEPLMPKGGGNLPGLHH